MPEPDKVREATAFYRENNDTIAHFISEKIISHQDKVTCKNSINETDFYSAFKIWFKDAYPNSIIPDKKEIQNDLKLRWQSTLKFKAGKWYGIRWKTSDDNDPDSDQEIEEKKSSKELDEKEEKVTTFKKDKSPSKKTSKEKEKVKVKPRKKKT